MKLNKDWFCYYTGLIKTFTFSRLANIFKCWLSFHISNLLSKPMVWGLPWAASIEPTTSCNLQCTQCPTGMRIITRPKGTLSIETFSILLNNFGAQLQYLTLYLQGEPLMNRDFCEMVKIARARNIFVFTSTNAHHITPQTAKEICLSGLNHILISLDGTTQETYETYRKGGSFDTVTEGIRNLLHARNELKTCNPFIEIQFIIFRHNQHQINDIKLLSKQLMVDRLSFKSAQIYELNEAEKFAPQQSTKVRYQKSQSGKWSLKKLPDNRCKRLWTTSSITWDGKMIPCCYDKNAQFEMGLPATQSLSELWNSQKINAFRKTVLKNQSSIEMCSNCGDRF